MSEEEDGLPTHTITCIAIWVLVCDFLLWLAWILHQVNSPDKV